VAEAANGSLGGFAQEGFELAKGRLDRVEVRRIARQVTQRRTGGLDGFAHTGDLMGFEVVDITMSPRLRVGARHCSR
jgi:hypothetical protein